MGTLYKTTTLPIVEIGAGFTLEEAFQLINQEVIKKENRHKPTSIETIGIVSGIYTYNDEIEITICFLNHEEKATKLEFQTNYINLK